MVAEGLARTKIVALISAFLLAERVILEELTVWLEVGQFFFSSEN